MSKLSSPQRMDENPIELLAKYYQKCAKINHLHRDFEKTIIITCVLISEARQFVFPAKIQGQCLSIESEIKKLINLKNEECEHLRLASNIFREIALHKFPSQTTVEHYLIATLSALNLGWKFKSDEINLMYPKIVHLETQAVCNAKCSFCEYDSLERKGVKMSDENIRKIISDLSRIPIDRMVQIQPYKISEPFLEKRLPWIVDEILDKIPGSNIRLISNGNLMTEEIIDWLVGCCGRKGDKSKGSITLSISLNSMEKDEYEKLMQINFDRTIKNLSALHERLDKLQAQKLQVILSRVSTSAAGDVLFAKKCADLFPGFQVSLVKLNDWFNYNENSRNQLIKMGVPLKSFRDLGCTRWGDLSIAADGSVALCCMDAGIRDLNLGNAFENNALDLYRRKNMRYVPSSGLRGDGINPCKSCSYFQNSGDILIKSLKQSLAIA